MTNHPPDMVQAVEPSAEEIEAAARALCELAGWPPDDLKIYWPRMKLGELTRVSPGHYPKWRWYAEQAQAALKAAMAVRRGK